jgi:glycosyltransferase involved in cell wall biosynthesis
MRDHVLRAFGREAEYIAYGAEVIHPGVERLAALDLAPDTYHLVVARFEPENQVREIVAGYVRSAAVMPLVVVGAAPYAQEYSDSVRRAAQGDARVRFVGAVWDQLLLDELYGNARSYVHGHTVGGTNPSLLRAMGAGAPVVAHDNLFNREVAGPSATFFADATALGDLLLADEASPAAAELRGEAGRAWVAERYRWDDVAADYERVAIRLTA